ncbi:hypothetical protein BC629DRAFT_1444516 [Irpex lacteus]|nr:hypothetical protein BC629DRAFT_1444516 [Irpex lacteus]
MTEPTAITALSLQVHRHANAESVPDLRAKPDKIRLPTVNGNSNLKQAKFPNQLMNFDVAQAGLQTNQNIERLSARSTQHPKIQHTPASEQRNTTKLHELQWGHDSTQSQQHEHLHLRAMSTSKVRPIRERKATNGCPASALGQAGNDGGGDNEGDGDSDNGLDSAPDRQDSTTATAAITTTAVWLRPQIGKRRAERTAKTTTAAATTTTSNRRVTTRSDFGLTQALSDFGLARACDNERERKRRWVFGASFYAHKERLYLQKSDMHDKGWLVNRVQVRVQEGGWRGRALLGAKGGRRLTLLPCMDHDSLISKGRPLNPIISVVVFTAVSLEKAEPISNRSSLNKTHKIGDECEGHEGIELKVLHLDIYMTRYSYTTWSLGLTQVTLRALPIEANQQRFSAGPSSERITYDADDMSKTHICSQKYGAIVAAIQLWTGTVAAVTLTIAFRSLRVGNGLDAWFRLISDQAGLRFPSYARVPTLWMDGTQAKADRLPSHRTLV